jgi:co-chaperonin GroES (HSP10)
MIQATNNFVFVIQDEEKSEVSGFIIPGKGRDKPNTGVIVTKGDLVRDTKIKPKRPCMFHKGIGFEIEYENQVYRVLAGEEIIAVL